MDAAAITGREEPFRLDELAVFGTVCALTIDFQTRLWSYPKTGGQGPKALAMHSAVAYSEEETSCMVLFGGFKDYVQLP
ncbi:hypothetical protein HDU91_004077, partial [Kappamyces sp. JEL0680]